MLKIWEVTVADRVARRLVAMDSVCLPDKQGLFIRPVKRNIFQLWRWSFTQVIFFYYPWKPYRFAELSPISTKRPRYS